MRFLPRIRLGIASKLALSIAALLLFATLIIGMLVYWNAEQVLKSSATDQLDHVSEIVDQRLDQNMMALREDTRFLAASPLVLRVATAAANTDLRTRPSDAADAGALRTLETIFSAFLEHHPHYFQVRLIGRQDNGREIVRADRRDDEIIITPADSLQQKGTRDYFQESIGLSPGTLYISEINLNRELGVIQRPETPTVRAAMPLYGESNDALGIVVINMDFGYALDQLLTLVPPSMSLYLTNTRGDFLLHPDPAMTFGFEKGEPHRIQDTFPASAPYFRAGEAAEGIAHLRPQVLYLHRFPLDRGTTSDSLFLGLSASYETIFAGVQNVQRNTILVMLLFCLVAIGLALVFAHVHTRPLRHIRREAEALGQNGDPLEPHNLPIERTDEIGVLARTFSRMTERLQSQMVELHHARQRAENANQLKTAFLSNMSHEIRTPLTVMVGFGDLLARKLSGEDKKLAQEIVQGGRRLTETLVSVLTLAELEAEGVTLHPQPLKLADLVREMASLFRWEAQRKGLTLTVDIHPAAQDALLFIDRGGFTSVLQNLIGNAIKFTTVGGIQILVERRQQASSFPPGQRYNGHLLIHVQDTGIGISEEFFATLFDPFTQESTGYTRAFEGSGLGLSIAKQLTEKMGGTISVKSEKGQGSRFTLRFPQLASEEKATPSQEHRGKIMSPSRPPSPKRLLVVEDNEETCFLIEQLLAEEYEVRTATNAQDALDAVHGQENEHIFDAVLMDINLGGGPSGRDVMQKLRRLPSYDRIPIAAVTAYALPGDREKLLSEGFTAYLRKPFVPEELKALVSGLFSKERKDR
ncbi:MAG TPA: ATP-binding protein [Rhodothermales bacterium]|nr:ATP-binding protein [Rhodothermales bacterium]